MDNKSTRIITIVLLVSVVAVCFSGTVQADVIYVDADAAGANNGETWTDAHNHLQDALAAAVTGDEIRIAQGTYKPDQGAGATAGDRTAAFQLISGVILQGGYAGSGEPNPDDRNVELYETILSGDLTGNDGDNFANNGENSYHVVTGSSTDATAVIEGVTITAGNANGADVYGDGSGMYNNLGSPTLKDCTFSRNWASTGGGGGIYDTNSSPMLTNCTFTGNWGWGMANYDGSSPTLTACNFTGSVRGMHNNNSSPTLADCTFTNNNNGVYNIESTPTLTNCTFNGNSYSFGNGAGMYNQNANPVLTDCTFTANSANYGAAVFNEYANPVLIKCNFGSNSANYGGAIYNSNSQPTLTNCTFTANSAKYHSGAIRNFKSNAVLNNCTFNFNTAGTDGGAIASSQSSPALTDCTFTENDAINCGGAIFNTSGTPTLTGCIFSENNAFSGAGVENQISNAIITGCTFTLNSAVEYGAAVNNRECSPQITRCMFLRNMANDFGGGAVCNWSSSPTIRNCLFSQNYSSQFGGAVMNNVSSLILFNCTFSQNSGAGSAVAFFSYLNDQPSTMQATNCIFWDSGEEIWKNEETNISITYSDIQAGWAGVGNINADPLFVNVAIDDYRLQPGSPCIDAGDPDYAALPNETDLNGNPRVVNGRIDMGAYEISASISVEVGISPDTINLKSQGKYITVLLTFSEGCDVTDVDVGSIRLQDQIQPLDWVWLDEETREVMVRFDREDVQTVLSVGNNVDVKITGSFNDGTPFHGTGVVTVINKGGGKSSK